MSVLESILASFKALDESGSGKIPISQLTALLKQLDECWTAQRVETICSRIDSDRDGNISYEDLVKWAFPDWEALFGEHLILRDSTIRTVHALKGRQCFLYFSAHWCPPCKAFTPKLAKAYRDCSDIAQIIYISKDKSLEEFQEYYSDMPWLAIPFSSVDLRVRLIERYGVKSIPHLIALAEDCSEISPGINFRPMLIQHEGDPTILSHRCVLEYIASKRLKEEAAIAAESAAQRDQETAGGPLLKRLSGDPRSEILEFRVSSCTVRFAVGFTSIGAPGLLKLNGTLYYEIYIVDTTGIPQFGFAAKGFDPSNHGQGVGNDDLSWAADGIRKKLWYGGKASDMSWETSWENGDVISLAANIDIGKIAVGRNGDWASPGGVVFENDRIKEGVFPAFSSRGFTVAYNLDGRKHGPFKYQLPLGIWDSVSSQSCDVHYFLNGKQTNKECYEQFAPINHSG